MPEKKKDWTLSGEALERLLACLDSDRKLAADKYESVRRKLMKLFEWRGCLYPDEFADRTIDRVARRVTEGVQLHPLKPYLYFHGVALNLLREYWKGPESRSQPIEAMPEVADASQPQDPADQRKYECLDRCLSQLPSHDRELLSRYHQKEGSNKERRKQIAENLNLPINALRIRVFRLRSALEKCVNACLKENADK